MTVKQKHMEAVRDDAFKILAKYAAQHEEWGTPGEFYTDIAEFSCPGGQLIEEDDHDLWIFRVSIGDEAGYWTLYVITNHGEYEEKPPTINSILQVFDTQPALIYHDGELQA